MAGFMGSTAAMKIFTVEAEKPDPNALRDHVFEAVPDPDGRMIGWVGLGNPLDTDFVFGIDQGQYLTWSLRIDERKPSAAAIRIRLAEAVKEENLKQGHCSGARKKELKEAITSKILAKTDYTPSLVDCIWNTETNRLYVATTSEKVLEILIPLFEKTFKAKTDPLFPEADMPKVFRAIFESEEGLALDADTTLTSSDWSAVMGTPASVEEPSKASIVNSQAAIETALGEGMEIVRMSLAASEEEQFSLSADLTVTGMKLPKGEKGDEPDAVFLLKADICARVARIVEALSKSK